MEYLKLSFAWPIRSELFQYSFNQRRNDRIDIFTLLNLYRCYIWLRLNWLNWKNWIKLITEKKSRKKWTVHWTIIRTWLTIWKTIQNLMTLHNSKCFIYTCNNLKLRDNQSIRVWFNQSLLKILRRCLKAWVWLKLVGIFCNRSIFSICTITFFFFDFKLCFYFVLINWLVVKETL